MNKSISFSFETLIEPKRPMKATNDPVLINKLAPK
jgi:hypothetical protein